jgi:hypothetical protein
MIVFKLYILQRLPGKAKAGEKAMIDYKYEGHEQGSIQISASE